MKKRQPQENNYKQQLIGVGALVGILLFIAGAFAVIRLVANQPRSTSSERGTDPASQLANDIERAFPLISILGVDENPENKRVVVLMFDPDPLTAWTQAEFDKVDAAILLAMEFASEADSDLTINILSETSVVTLQGESVPALSIASTILCWVTAMEDIDWDRADHDTITSNCIMFPVGQFWGNAEMILWPLEASR